MPEKIGPYMGFFWKFQWQFDISRGIKSITNQFDIANLKKIKDDALPIKKFFPIKEF
jgi:hypothetical protein